MRIEQYHTGTPEPVLLNEVKEHLRLDADHEDAKLMSVIASARAAIEAQFGLQLIDREIDIYLDCWPSVTGMEGRVSPTNHGAAGLSSRVGTHTSVALPARPVSEIVSISLLDEEGAEVIWDAGNYALVPGLAPVLYLRAGSGWPSVLRPREGVKIKAVSGFGPTWNSIPEDIHQALLHLITSRYFHRGDDAANAGFPANPGGVDRFMAPYRHVRI